jgi:hypothetical protein
MKLAVIVLAWAGATLGAETPGEFAYAVPVLTEGNGAFYRVTLPQPVYEGVVRGDMGDLRVFNVAGEVVPHAIQKREATAPASQPQLAVPLFPLHGETRWHPEHSSIHIQTRPDGTIIGVAPAVAGRGGGTQLAGYIADLSAHKGTVAAVELERPTGAAAFVGKLTVEGSDELAGWRVLVREAPVLSLTSGAAQLQRLRVEFAPQSARYLRLTWPSAAPTIELAGIRVEPGAGQPEPKRHWKTVTARQDKENEYLIEPGGQFPTDRLRVRLPQPNTVAPVEVLARSKPGDPWRALARTVLYRLNSDQGEVVSPDIVLPPAPGRVLLLRVDGQGGGIGKDVLSVEVGWVPHNLVFAARGTAPFQIAYGNAVVDAAAYPIESLIPDYRHPPEPTGMTILPAGTGEPVTRAGNAALRRPVDIKRWALWSSLVLGVAALGFMAWRLSRQMGRAPGTGADSGQSPSG